MDPQKQRDIARKGGRAVSQDRQHMADIGRKGGQEVSQDTAHMSEIGRKGGEASHGGRRGGLEQQQSRSGRQGYGND
jgi:general stress protein YciG